MLYIAVAVYFITIAFGIGNLASSIRRIVHYRTVAFIHGALASAGLLLVFFHIAAVSYTPFLLIIFAVLSVATLGGLAILSYRLKHQRAPMKLRVFHPLIALLGFILLVVYILP